MKVSISALLCALASVLAVLVTPAHAMIMGDEPTIAVQREGNTLLSYEVEGLMATKGIVQAQVSDRFVLELSAEITDGTSILDDTDPSLLPLLADKDTSLKNGSEVDLTGVVQSLDESAPELKAALDAGKSLTLTARVSLVLQDGSGALHIQGTIQASTFVEPIDS